MSGISMKVAKEVKKAFPNFLIMYKVGKFYQSYSRDAVILASVFNYKITSRIVNTNKMYISGFPLNALPKVMANLENLKINYLVLDKRNSYEIDEKSDNKDLNKYDEYAEKYLFEFKIKNRAQAIKEQLVELCELELIRKIENVIMEEKVERGKI